ncbi:penicillin acylase family protein [Flagellimonas sp.]|uniref:penicillin acylase family protein n=1 Tax=Flagellimonas sp. TaxID=2058762 RepID=UPI003F49E009
MRLVLTLIVVVIFFSCNDSNLVSKHELTAHGLKEPVEIVRDKWGVNHIYAKNQHDLFYAQGYTAAADRLFQFEIWRRQATGTVAEILGAEELNRDIGTRLFKFRGDMTTEMNHYHEDGVEIITAYTQGVNAYIDAILKTPEKLPVEFKILGIQPQKWTPEVVISRHQGLLGNIGLELQVGRAVAKLGPEKIKDLYWFHPKDPNIAMDPSINTDLLSDDILTLYNAYRKPVAFTKDHIVPNFQNIKEVEVVTSAYEDKNDMYGIGSNNWVIHGSRMADGNSYMANDPHRTVAVPSLRYMNHLVAPGWNVIGGGEPEIPGISIGHNEYGAWGLTVFRTDGEDLYVYELNPDNPNQYKYKGDWVDMKQLSETIKVKGENDHIAQLFYTQHGPVTHIDSINHVAYAVRCAWLEPGGSPYLASLRMDQAKSWEEFRDACNYSHIPGENMIWADKEGNIGWQAVGIAPVRRNFSGLVPVPGDGRYEWDGYLPIIEKPNDYNPTNGYLATANQNVTPEDYQHWDAIGYSWSDPFRGDRVNEVLESDKILTMEDMMALQTDYLSIPARILVPMLEHLVFTGTAEEAKKRLVNWNYKLEANSIPAAIYVAWENQIKKMANEKFIPQEGKGIVPGIQLAKIIQWIQAPDTRFGESPMLSRNQFLSEAFQNGVADLEKKLGPDMDFWHYGQEKYKHTYMQHALSGAVNDSLRAKLDLGPLPRGGNAYTPGSTGSNLRQSSGATFRIIVNTGDWDATLGSNGPGQSGNPDSPFYDNLFKPWANDEYFPVYYSREKIDSVAVTVTQLIPLGK